MPRTSFNTAASALKELNWQGSMALLHRAVAYRLPAWNYVFDMVLLVQPTMVLDVA